MKAAKTLQTMYLDFVNNYLTIQVYAEHNDLTDDEARTVLKLGREVHERLVVRHKELKAN